jgi:hypothetical protein
MGVYSCKAKVYSWFFAGARGLLSKISFFFYINRVRGLELYNTVLENLYENILFTFNRVLGVYD